MMRCMKSNNIAAQTVWKGMRTDLLDAASQYRHALVTLAVFVCALIVVMHGFDKSGLEAARHDLWFLLIGIMPFCLIFLKDIDFVGGLLDICNELFIFTSPAGSVQYPIVSTSHLSVVLAVPLSPPRFHLA